MALAEHDPRRRAANGRLQTPGSDREPRCCGPPGRSLPASDPGTHADARPSPGGSVGPNECTQVSAPGVNYYGSLKYGHDNDFNQDLYLDALIPTTRHRPAACRRLRPRGRPCRRQQV